MRKITYPVLFITGLLLLNCSCERHFITDTNYRKQVNQQYESRCKLAHLREDTLFGVFDKSLSKEQEEALKFLYAYMPLSDLADYDGDYFLQQVDLSLKARKTFSWGKSVPEDVFRHFVLPIRVNNENLDTSRAVFFNELKERVKHLSMVDAALEVNHWCHEKVNYRPGDARTSSPLASVRTSFGRCGEESTFTVAAMRSVGIPARQVYTPRWAHTDDNHAWVEVYVDGKWQYLGACEPEAVLNKGWFDVPVKRAMMVHTNVMGIYSGDEDVLEHNDLYTKINSLSSYTVTQPLIIRITDKQNKPVPDARVEFRIYNYAEFYPMVIKQSDDKGMAVLQTGLGDLQVWASKDGLYGYSRVSVGAEDTVVISLNRKPGIEYSEVVNNVPPVEKLVESVTAARQEENNRRLAQEDSIRNAYMATFMLPAEAEQLALELKLDTSKVKRLVALSYGNWQEIASYMKSNAANPFMLDLLESISEKDLRDTPARYLEDHLKNADTYERPKGLSSEVFNEGVLSPRVLNELIRPWRSFLQGKFDRNFTAKAQSDISVITGWIKDSITLNKTENYMGCPISPIGVYELRTADERSRNIFFVALCRSLSIPARIDQATLLPQVFKDNGWVNISFETTEAPVKNAQLILTNDSHNPVTPEYSIHFTIQKFMDGHFTTLDYEGSELLKEFPATLDLEPGYYLLMTGHRRDDGSVLIRSDYFNLNKGDQLTMPVILEPLEQKLNVAGIIGMEQKVTDWAKNIKTLQELAGDKGLVLAFINPANEPTRHVMNDIPLLKADFEKWGGHFLFMIPPANMSKDFQPTGYKNLPSGSLFMVDEGNNLMKSLLKTTGLKTTPPYPFVMYVNSKGEITFMSMGYRIGIGENLLKASKSL